MHPGHGPSKRPPPFAHAPVPHPTRPNHFPVTPRRRCLSEWLNPCFIQLEHAPPSGGHTKSRLEIIANCTRQLLLIEMQTRQKKNQLRRPRSSFFSAGSRGSTIGRTCWGPFSNTDCIFDRPYLENSVLKMPETLCTCQHGCNAPWVSGEVISEVMVPELLSFW
jgi:hypothetical protein